PAWTSPAPRRSCPARPAHRSSRCRASTSRPQPGASGCRSSEPTLWWGPGPRAGTPGHRSARSSEGPTAGFPWWSTGARAWGVGGPDGPAAAGGVWLPLVGTDAVVGSGSPGGDSGSSVGSLVGVSDVGLSVVLDGGSHVGGEEGGTLVGSVVVVSAGDVSEVVV